MEFILNNSVSWFMNLFLSILFYIMCMYVHEKKSQKEALDPLALKIEMWHLLDVGAGNWILVPCKSIKDLAAEPSPQPMIFNAF